LLPAGITILPSGTASGADDRAASWVATRVMVRNAMTRATDLISHNVAAMKLSAIAEMSMRSAQVPGAASLSWGLPSFRTPEHIRDVVKKSLDEDPDVGKYALPNGLPELRRLIAEKHLRETGIEVDPDDEVLVTAGNMQGINTLLHMLINPGDEIIITDPGFVSHAQQIVMCGGKPVYWRLDEAQVWSLDTEALRQLITPRTKGLIIVSPSNPTGKIFTEQELRRVGDIALQHNLLVLLDDPYSRFLYENRDRHFNLSSVRELAGQSAYLFSFSKAHAMSGWRLGYMILPGRLRAEALKVHNANLICTPRISQVAGIAALSGPSPHLKEFEETLGQRRRLICERLDRVPHVFSYHRPEGAYYVFPKIEVPHSDSLSFCLDLLDSAKVALTPGSAFGPSGEHHVRMAFCVSQDTINLAFDRIEARFPR
jgi:aspartate/methionine/tyrosine aminotransferase